MTTKQEVYECIKSVYAATGNPPPTPSLPAAFDGWQEIPPVEAVVLWETGADVCAETETYWGGGFDTGHVWQVAGVRDYDRVFANRHSGVQQNIFGSAGGPMSFRFFAPPP